MTDMILILLSLAIVGTIAHMDYKASLKMDKEDNEWMRHSRRK